MPDPTLPAIDHEIAALITDAGQRIAAQLARPVAPPAIPPCWSTVRLIAEDAIRLGLATARLHGDATGAEAYVAMRAALEVLPPPDPRPSEAAALPSDAPVAWLAVTVVGDIAGRMVCWDAEDAEAEREDGATVTPLYAAPVTLAVERARVTPDRGAAEP